MRARIHGEKLSSNMTKRFSLKSENNRSFGRMFPDLTDSDHRLPETPETIKALRVLGSAMASDPSNEEASIPAVFTYLGQFLDHDITKMEFSESIRGPLGEDLIELSNFSPLTDDQISSEIFNGRTPSLDLDSIYGGLAEREPDDVKMILGEVTPVGFGPIDSSDLNHDLPRATMILEPSNIEEVEADRQALIGDPRNDENLLVAQLHLAFLRSHNAIAERDGGDFNEVSAKIRRRYQWTILNEFLPAICGENLIEDIKTNGPKFFDPKNLDDAFLPVEFSGAAYRFGHSMVRQEYDYNSTFNPSAVRATFNFFFTFTALSGDLSAGGGPDTQNPTLPNNWIIEWHRFLADEEGLVRNPARRIDAAIAPELGALRDFQGIPIQSLMGKLATRNLLRGYLLGLPTGQAVANKLGVPPLNESKIIEAVSEDARVSFIEAGLDKKTPLWFYILAEAGDPDGPNGNSLGPVGGRIVGETIFSLIKLSKDSVILSPPKPEDIDTGEFSLSGLIGLGRDPVVGQGLA